MSEKFVVKNIESHLGLIYGYDVGSQVTYDLIALIPIVILSLDRTKLCVVDTNHIHEWNIKSHLVNRLYDVTSRFCIHDLIS